MPPLIINDLFGLFFKIMNKFKKVIVGLVAIVSIASSALFFVPSGADAATRVGGYYRKSGTYVAPYYRSTSNSTKADNWSTKGNYNPYTGKAGTKTLNWR